MALCTHCDKQVDAGDEFCRSCGTPIHKENMDVVYGTESWTTRQRSELTETLLNKGIPHEWDGADVTVPGQYEKIVDEILTWPPPKTQPDAQETMNDRREMELFKRPYYSDWCIWLGTLAVISGIFGVASERGTNAIDYIFAIVIQWSFFAGGPAIIRRQIYRRRG